MISTSWYSKVLTSSRGRSHSHPAAQASAARPNTHQGVPPIWAVAVPPVPMAAAMAFTLPVVTGEALLLPCWVMMVTRAVNLTLRALGELSPGLPYQPQRGFVHAAGIHETATRGHTPSSLAHTKLGPTLLGWLTPVTHGSLDKNTIFFLKRGVESIEFSVSKKREPATIQFVDEAIANTIHRRSCILNLWKKTCLLNHRP